MNCTERITAALTGTMPDCVPYIYNCVDASIQEGILGHPISEPTINDRNVWGALVTPGTDAIVEPALTVVPDVARRLKLDAVGIQVLPPLYAEISEHEGRTSIRDGLLTSREALKKIKLPDPDDNKLYRKIENMLSMYKQEFAVYARVRLGAAPTLLSMGMNGFAFALVDDPGLVSDVLSLYSKWSRRVSQNLSKLCFDFFWCFDDIAYKTSPLFSLETLRQYFLPALQTAAAGISKPWIFHSDGNLLPILDDLLTLGMNGLHPLEPGAMDLEILKKNYGQRICLVGNVDVDSVLSRGKRADVFREVNERITQLSAGGRYIISDSNSVPAYCRCENVIAMAEAVEKYRFVY